MLSLGDLKAYFKPKAREIKAKCPHRITIMVTHDRSFLPGVNIGYPGPSILANPR